MARSTHHQLNYGRLVQLNRESVGGSAPLLTSNISQIDKLHRSATQILNFVLIALDRHEPRARLTKRGPRVARRQAAFGVA